MVFLDLKQTFDTVNHSLQLKKLENFGIMGRFLSRLSSYIKSRTQWVIWRNRNRKNWYQKMEFFKVLFWVLFCLYCTLMTLWTLVNYPFSIFCRRHQSPFQKKAKFWRIKYWNSISFTLATSKYIGIKRVKTLVMNCFWNQGKHKLSKLHSTDVQHLKISRINSQ